MKRPGRRRPRSLALVALAISLASLGCDGRPDDVGTLRIGPGVPPWEELLDGAPLDLELGLQGLLMLPISLEASLGASPGSESVVNVEIRLLDTGALLSRHAASAIEWEQVGAGRWQTGRIELISAQNDPAAIRQRNVEVDVELRRHPDEPPVATLRRTFWLRDPETPAECVYPDAAPVATAPLFTNVTIAAGLVHDHGSQNTGPDCLLRTTPGGSTPLCAPERASGAVAVADYDGDGWPDLFFSSPTAEDHLYRNQGDGSFVDTTSSSGLGGLRRSSGASWADIDDDGDLDLYLTTIGEMRNYLFINDGSGHFVEEAESRGAAIASTIPHAGMSVAVGDYDLDGHVDLFVGEWAAERALAGGRSHARLLRNRGATMPGHFVDATLPAGIDVEGLNAQGANDKGTYIHAPGFVDLDGDGWPELTLASDFGTSRLFWNEADGTFSDGTASAEVGTDGFGMGSAFADFDGDGDLDWFITSITRLCDITEFQGNRLYLHAGGREFVDATDEAGVFHGGWGWGALPFELENDGDVDLVHTAGNYSAIFANDPMRLFRNDGAFPFAEVAAESGLDDLGQGRGMATLDYDGDGDLDLVVARNGDTPLLYRNDDESGNGFLRIRLVGDETNAMGLGARILLTRSPGAAPQIREMGVGGHYMGQSEAIAHFGLGPSGAPVHQVLVHWPGSGSVTMLDDVAPDQTLVIME